MTGTQLLIPQPHTSASTETVSRHPLNFYESPSWFTTELLRHVRLSGVIGEPCVGHGAIASLLNFNYEKNNHVLSIFRASAFMGRERNCELRIANCELV
jgi:hypothetical protein